MEPAEILQEFSVAASGDDLAFDGEALWVGIAGEARAVRLDPTNGTERASIALPAGGSSAGLTWTSAGDAPGLWCCAADGGDILELDPDSGEERRRIPACGEGRLGGLCTDGAAGPTIWFLCTQGIGEESACRAGRFDSRDGEVHKRIVVSPDAKGLAWDGRWLWSARSEAKRLIRIDPMFADVTHTIELDFTPAGVACDADGLWVSDRDAARVVRIARPAA